MPVHALIGSRIGFIHESQAFRSSAASIASAFFPLLHGSSSADEVEGGGGGGGGGEISNRTLRLDSSTRFTVILEREVFRIEGTRAVDSGIDAVACKSAVFGVVSKVFVLFSSATSSTAS